MFRSRPALKLFYSYAHEDEKLRDKLETALALLRREKYIESWHDRRITGGKEWAGQIDENLAAADIVLLLISPDFMDSDYCSEVELKSALERHNQGLSRVVPILLRHTDWETSDIAKLQSFPTDAEPITTWSNEDKAFKNVAQGIRRIVEELQRVKSPGSQGEPVVVEVKDRLTDVVRRHWALTLLAAFILLTTVGILYTWSRSNAIAAQAESWLDIGDYSNALINFKLASRWNLLSTRAKNGVRISQVALVRNDAVNFRRGIADLSSLNSTDPHVRVLTGDLAFHENSSR